MRSTILIILVCCLSAVLAYPYEGYNNDGYEYQPIEYSINQYQEMDPTYEEGLRAKRQIQLQGGGGGSPGKGYDVSIDGRAPVWTSNNGRHEVGVSGGYSQHLGGPYGNSRPDYRVGAGYTFRF